MKWFWHWWTKPYWYGITMAVVITLTTSYALLDNFVIIRAGTSGENVMTSSSNSISVSSISPTFTDMTYQDSNMLIEIETYRQYETMIHLAHVTITDITLLKTALANDTYGKNITEKTSEMATRKNAIFAISGDYYGYRDYGFVIRNGILYRTANRMSGIDDALILSQDGTLQVVDEVLTTRDELLALNPLHAWSFGPTLIKDGQIVVTKDSKVPYEYTSNPRTAMAQVSVSEFYFMVTEGRTEEDRGLSLLEMASILSDLGAETAYNLDGGGTATMWFNGRILNELVHPGSSTGERNISDMIYFGYE